MKKINLVVILLFSYLFVFPFGQLARLPLIVNGFPEVHFYLTDIFVFFLVFSWLTEKWFKKKRFVLPPLGKPIFLFSLLAFFSLLVNSPLLSNGEVAVAGLYLVRWLFYSGLYFVSYDLSFSRAAKVSSIKYQVSNLLIYVGVVTAIFGLIQYLFLPDTRFLESYGWDPHYYRLIGTFFDPGFLGLIFVLSLIIIVTKIWQEKEQKKRLIAASLVLYLALALTYSRASYLAYSLAIGLIAWWQKSMKLAFIILTLGLITLFLLPRPGGEGVRLERESTIKARILNWQQTIKISQDNLLFGVGFNAYRYVQDKYFPWPEGELAVSHAAAGADSSLLFVLATTGLFGLGAYLWLGIKALLLSFKGIKKTQNQIAFASLLVVLLHSFFANSLFYPWIMAWLWLILGSIKESKSL